MRSTVSYMLSHGSGEPTMSHPDYEQQAHHHSCLLVLIRGIGSSKPRSLQRIFERIQNVNNVKIKDSSGVTRDIWVRYVRDHPIENNEWGDFQTHRRLLGLITVGKFDGQTELNELCRVHESLKVKYTNTLYDSRCIMFGSTKPKRNDDGDNLSLNSESTDVSIEAVNTSSPINDGRKLEELFTTPPNFKSNAKFYWENEACADLEYLLSEFVCSLFWILEAKRLDRSHEKIEKVSLLLAPFEKKDFVGLDMDTRNMRKRCVGRVTKNLADLTLQSGLVAESLPLFQAAIETLRAISDSLWLGAANEGLCAASAILLYPHIRFTTSFQRNASLQENSSPQRLNANRSPSQDNLSKQILNKKTNLMINLNPNGIENGISMQSSASSSSASSVAPSSSCSSSIASSSSSSASTPVANSSLPFVDKLSACPPNVLQPSDIVTKYREAIINYSKYRHAGIIETEAALKAARICIEVNRNLDVACFLQNVLYINLKMNDQERVQRFETLTELYHKIGFTRKAAFCQRLAAWRHVAQSNTMPDWNQSYRLMLDSFAGHKLSLDPLEVLQNNAGWPCLQIDLLQQLIAAARRLGQSALATRHMTFLLQTMWQHLSTSEQKELSLQLQSLSAQCEGAPVPLVLETGTVIPPANLTDLPYCQQFKVKNLASHMRPYKIVTNKVDNGPFLFTPINFGSIDRRAKKNDGKITFQWVQNDMCEVSLCLKNPLPFELKVSDIRLLTNGVVFESMPQTVVLPIQATTNVTLFGTPIEHGSLEIQGYSTHTLGVKSNCRLKHMMDRSAIFPPTFTVDVIPALPRLEITTSLQPMDTLAGMANMDNIIASTSLTMYNGEQTECTLTLKNTSNITIEFLEESIQSPLDSKVQSQVFLWSKEEIQSQLPLKPNESLTIHLKVFAHADFLGPVAVTNAFGAGASLSSSSHNQTDAAANSLSVGMSAYAMSGHTSLPSRMGSPINVPKRNDLLSSSFRSKATHSGHSSLVTYSLNPSNGTGNPQKIDAQFRFRYSGGEAQQQGHCRNCAVLFSLEFLPSAQITNWDVLPAETPTEFYLVLDVSNLTAQEMLLNYTSNKNIVIEAHESCRVPVPVERCSLFDAKEEKPPEDYQYIYKDENNKNQRICSDHISKLVKLNWSLLGSDIKGTASLKGITLSSAMLGLISVPPLKWEIFINAVRIPSQSDITCLVGQSIPMRVEICNQSPNELKDLVLTIQFYQDYQNGTTKYRLETRVTTSGPNEVMIKSLKTNEKTQHECSAIFFTAGRFKTSIECGNAATMLSEQTTFGAAETAHQANELDSQVWRYIPAPEIIVVE